MTRSTSILVVSGLPRSGTSLVMQMLQAGGVPLLVDHVRPADADNPRGYFEYEPVKRLRSNHEWLPQAVGKAIKIVRPLLEFLPSGFDYRIVILERELSEVIASQQAMLVRNGQQGATLSDAELVAAYERQLAATDRVLAARRDFTLLRVEHRSLLANPAAEVRRLAQFAQPIWPNIQLDEPAMAAVVDPALYRQRSSG